MESISDHKSIKSKSDGIRTVHSVLRECIQHNILCVQCTVCTIYLIRTSCVMRRQPLYCTMNILFTVHQYYVIIHGCSMYNMCLDKMYAMCLDIVYTMYNRTTIVVYEY